MKVDVIYNKSSQRMTELPDESIDMCLTSPPYWGLRDYGEDVKEIWASRLWGSRPDCNHDWGNDILPKGNKSGPHGPNSTIGAKLGQDGVRRGKGSNFCLECNAWYGQLGLEPTFQLYLDHMMIVCAEIKRVLKKTGSFWLNMGDTYSGSGKGHGWIDPKYKNCYSARNELSSSQFEINLPAKCLLGIPWRLVLRLIDEQNWILRNAIIWHKPNAMPSSVKDRCSNSYEFLFYLVKAKKYYYDLDAIREPHSQYSHPFSKGGEFYRENLCENKSPKYQKTKEASMKYGYGSKFSYMRRNPSGKNPGDVWTIPTQPRPEAHFATFPDKLCIKPILATCPIEICRKCGKARVRIKEKPLYGIGDTKTKASENGQPNIKHLAERRQFYRSLGYESPPTAETIGWTDCGCNAGWDAGILLDPFAGRGTALIVAKKLGRHYVGYELKKEYCEKLIKPALEEIDPLFRRR